MPPQTPRLAIAALILSMAGAAQAAQVERVDIRGLDEAMTANVQVSLSLVDAIGKELSGRRLAYLMREAENETREALEPFGYYSPTITIERTRDGVTTVINSDPAPGSTNGTNGSTPPPATAGGTAPSPGAPVDAPPEAPVGAVAGAPAPADAGPADGTPLDSTARAANRSPVVVTITVDRGEPVTVRGFNLAISGEGEQDRYLREDLALFQPRPGAVFDHTQYEASKTRITRRLAERGYFDADFASREVQVTRAERAADVDLSWTSGRRYDMGPITFTQEPRRIIKADLLDKLVYWEQGSYYHQGKLDRLRDSLARLDYFSGIDIEPRPDAAVDGEVPVAVTLTPAKRSIYTAGLSYGTDSGAGVRGGIERRYVNQRGHKALAQVDWAQRRKTLTLQYRVPAFAWRDGWYTISAQAADEQTDYVDNRRIELVASRSGTINRRLTATASVHALRERWAYAAEDDGDEATPLAYRYATFSYPSLRAEYVSADDRLQPRNGLGGTLMLRGGIEGAGSDASFAQMHATARWYRGLGANSRLIARGELGHTFTDALVDMPPSLRFFAGGDRSIRGYAWREVGPRITGANGANGRFALGAKNVVTGSLEYEQYFNSSWGAAAFVDSGSAFDDSPDLRTGVGIGLRWRSPVGPLRIDIARGLDDPDSGFQLYLNIGADL